MSPSIVTPGNYDGVHLGHRELLRRARAMAERSESEARVVSMIFDPHPARLFAPERAPTLLTTIARRKELLLRSGADAVEVMTFDRSFAQQSPDEFVRARLVAQLGAEAVVVGPDFRFGKGRAGELSTLRRLGEELGYTVETVDPVELDGDVVSSTRIRAALERGAVDDARRLLGRVHDVDGTVVLGDQRGRTIGFPTANLRVDPPVQLPADGVYAVVARSPRVEGLMLGVANLGVRPTFEAGRSLEAHLFDFDKDLYDSTLRLGFVARLREERAFDGLEALEAQIERDAAAARAELESADRGSWAWI